MTRYYIKRVILSIFVESNNHDQWSTKCNKIQRKSLLYAILGLFWHILLFYINACHLKCTYPFGNNKLHPGMKSGDNVNHKRTRMTKCTNTAFSANLKIYTQKYFIKYNYLMQSDYWLVPIFIHSQFWFYTRWLLLARQGVLTIPEQPGSLPWWKFMGFHVFCQFSAFFLCIKIDSFEIIIIPG